MPEVLLDRCRPGHMCPEAEEKWALVQEAREDDIALRTDETRVRAAVTLQLYREHKYKCEGNCDRCLGGGWLMKGESDEVECWKCGGTGEA